MLNTYPQKPGTYCFLNTVNNKVYSGSAQCLNTRLNQHFNNQNSRPILQDAIKKYSLKAFNITYVITETHAEAQMQEQLMLDYLFQNNVPRYNLSANAYGGDGYNAKVRYALEVNSPNNIYTFKSSVEAEKITGVLSGNVFKYSKMAIPCNSKSGRWLFSNISIEDLQTKFENLTQNELKGLYNRKFILISKSTKKQSQIFNSVLEPQKQGYIKHISALSQCLLGKRKTVNGYYVTLCI